MLRIKRSVATQYAAMNYIGSKEAASTVMGMVRASDSLRSSAVQADAMAVLETQQHLDEKTTSVTTRKIEIAMEDEPVAKKQKLVEKNEEEINIDLEEMDVEEKAVPVSVFGKK
jgi:hypothetical protein